MKTLYRIEHAEAKTSLWYDSSGNKTDFILSLDGMMSAGLEMPFDPELAGGWLSSVGDLPDLCNWVSSSDVEQLAVAGHRLFAVDVTAHRDIYGHTVFKREAVVSSRQLPFAALEAVRA